MTSVCTKCCAFVRQEVADVEGQPTSCSKGNRDGRDGQSWDRSRQKSLRAESRLNGDETVLHKSE